jgi:hypothetical protein
MSSLTTDHFRAGLLPQDIGNPDSHSSNVWMTTALGGSLVIRSNMERLPGQRPLDRQRKLSHYQRRDPKPVDEPPQRTAAICAQRPLIEMT